MAYRTVIRRRLVGTALRQYREAFGFTLADVAELLECDRSKISRIETGHRGVRAKELRELLEWYGVAEREQDLLLAIEQSTRGARSGWWQDCIKALPGSKLEYVVLEERASQILIYGPAVVPDLLQTHAYALATALTDRSQPAGIEEGVALAVQMRQAAVREVRQTDLHVVVAEAALHQQVGDRWIMREQLRALAELGNGNSAITVQVLPSETGVPPVGGSGSFSILSFTPTPALGVVHLDGPAGGVCIDDRQEVAAYTQAFAQLHVAALNPDASLELIRQLAAD